MSPENSDRTEAGPPPPRHTDREYEAELARIREQILMMGAKVEEMIGGGIASLTRRDVARARHIIEQDVSVDRLEIETDELCLNVLARRQPVASDLRFITMVLKTVTDLERIGDLAVNVCERVVELSADPPLQFPAALASMGQAAQRMVREALDAFVAGDAERARAVIAQDQAVDAFYVQSFRELLTYMMEDAHTIARATRLQSIAKYFERIGDHACNLAEMVIFMVQGKDVRHGGRALDLSEEDWSGG